MAISVEPSLNESIVKAVESALTLRMNDIWERHKAEMLKEIDDSKAEIVTKLVFTISRMMRVEDTNDAFRLEILKKGSELSSLSTNE